MSSRASGASSRTLLFCDLAGSTALGERFDPERVHELMGRYFEGASSAIARHGGTVEKFAGDAVMAVFGVPEAHEDDPLRACRAALELRASVQELELACRIGINTGEVVAADPSQRRRSSPVMRKR